MNDRPYHLTPEGLKENLNLYFTEYFPTTDQVVNLYDQRGWWPDDLIGRELAKIKHRIILDLIRSIRDEDGFRSVHILKVGGKERIVQEELFTSAKEYHVVIAEYYQARREGEEIIQHLNKNCYYRYGIEVPAYEDYLQNPDDPKWHMDES